MPRPLLLGMGLLLLAAGIPSPASATLPPPPPGALEGDLALTYEAHREGCRLTAEVNGQFVLEKETCGTFLDILGPFLDRVGSPIKWHNPEDPVPAGGSSTQSYSGPAPDSSGPDGGSSDDRSLPLPPFGVHLSLTYALDALDCKGHVAGTVQAWARDGPLRLEETRRVDSARIPPGWFPVLGGDAGCPTPPTDAVEPHAEPPGDAPPATPAPPRPGVPPAPVLGLDDALHLLAATLASIPASVDEPQAQATASEARPPPPAPVDVTAQAAPAPGAEEGHPGALHGNSDAFLQSDSGSVEAGAGSSATVSGVAALHARASTTPILEGPPHGASLHNDSFAAPEDGRAVFLLPPAFALTAQDPGSPSDPLAEETGPAGVFQVTSERAPVSRLQHTGASQAPPLTLPWLAAGALGALLAALYARLTRAALTANPLRQRILQLLEEDPGLSAHQLARRTGKRLNGIQHHLRKLQGAGLVVSREQNGIRRFFHNGDPRIEQTIENLMGAIPRVRLLRVIEGSPGVSIEKAAEAAGLGYSNTRYYVRSLVKGGKVRVVRDGRASRLLPVPQAANLQETIRLAA